mmetsp:Transcript_28292/g.92351  ORF Transcript_28292/g.92351 Transcript_28292/m.92351 type:complete len:460 (-) Transcript_28292:180-1559(-)|eukprot:CAMPEP_0170144386 /NCGR_PEP_ID=MMETSP0033_2-20121228/13451_1 /TAXON_ID=195969 /ORGANISM="Dolichomastix tenuilepis, Strain CCMP3274" /LENGTH=459 /DNA_ID=CAMNT_0010380881 /DNA_START=157 /DNA_END=1536 /DNA_ORIENTATION=-
MSSYYAVQFALLALVCVALELPKGNREKVAAPAAFLSFRNNYLFVYSLAMSGDWLQGPYVYALYAHYGYTQGDIGKLFIAGFGSSMIFGTLAGALGDKYGRKKAALAYCATYIASCITKHSSDYYVLMLGRFFGGIATSLLFSAFESWLVCEHFKRGYEERWLGITFSKAVFMGNGVMAILSGLLGNILVDNFALGPVAPFDAASILLIGCSLIIYFSWSENYGDSGGSDGGTGSLAQQFQTAVRMIASDQKIALLGAMQALFEASMYSFVFLWTPALSPNDEVIPHGFIFATFMLSSMIGSSIANRLLSNATLRVEEYMRVVFGIAAASLSLPIWLDWFRFIDVPGADGGISFVGQILLVGFCVFEGTVGIFWPSIMKMRSQYVPEEVRATIINVFRIPLNLFVCCILYNVSAFPIAAMFGMCSVFLCVAAYCQHRLMLISGPPVGGELDSAEKNFEA